MYRDIRLLEQVGLLLLKTIVVPKKRKKNSIRSKDQYDTAVSCVRAALSPYQGEL
jgi:hypothetical protein